MSLNNSGNTFISDGPTATEPELKIMHRIEAPHTHPSQIHSFTLL